MLSIVIPTLNEERYLPRLLDSIKKQTYKDYEVIVADGNSKDKTRKIARKYGCRIVGGGSPAKARNKGADRAKGKYILFVDADVILFDSSFFHKVSSISEKRKIDTATFWAKPIDGNIMDSIFHVFVNCYMFLIQKISPHPWGPCMFISRELHKKIKGFDIELKVGEDMDYIKRASNNGRYAFLFIPFGISVRRFKKMGYIKSALTYLRIATSKRYVDEINKGEESFEFYGETKED